MIMIIPLCGTASCWLTGRTGGNTEYNHLPNGARVILMKENARTFTTWIRIKGGEIVDKTVYPDSYRKDDWRKRPPVGEK